MEMIEDYKRSTEYQVMLRTELPLMEIGNNVLLIKKVYIYILHSPHSLWSTIHFL